MPPDWQTPTELPDLRNAGVLALDTETKDDRLRADMGSGWPFRAGHLCGVSVAYHAEGGIRGHYFPLRHPDTQNFDPEQVYQWVRDHVGAGVRFVTQNGLYDWGWLRTEAGIHMPPGEHLEEISALATMVDENRFKYSLDALCAWRGLPGKDETLLYEGIKALGLHTNRRQRIVPQNYLWQLPARYVGPYAEADAVNTLALFENLDPILDQEGTRNAYRLECDILPMVLEMRLRGIRIDLDAAEQARDLLLRKRDAALTELSEQLGCAISMHEIQGRKWLVETFDRLCVKYPRTEKGNASFTSGKLGWMAGHGHWLPPLIATANKYNKAVADFVEKIITYTVNGRIHAEINPHRSENNGTKSFRFSYNDPPLQQMPSRDEELAPLIRGIFLPEEGEVWAKPDASQQEFRLVVHYANQHKLRKAGEAVARYLEDPNADFHALAATMTGLDRGAAKTVNFGKIYGAGVQKFAVMTGKPLAEAQRLYEQYDRELPFLRQLSDIYSGLARRQGYIVLYDGARRHFDRFAPGGKWKKGAGPCSLEEARERLKNPDHPWYRRGPLYRADVRTALNALIQGSAARHTKLWMRACWREGVTPLLQMHDCLDCSVSSREQAELIARLGCEAVQLDVPMRVDLKFGHSWGDAKHTWEELHQTVSTIVTLEPKEETPRKPVTQGDVDEINIGLGRESIEPINIPAAPTVVPWEEAAQAFARAIPESAAPMPLWSMPIITGVPPGPEIETILAALAPKDRAIVQPTTEAPQRNGHDRWDAGKRANGSKILCPFHDDHNPSLQIYSDGHFHCFVCQAHGDAEELPDMATAPDTTASSPAMSDTRKLERSLQLWQAAGSITGTLAERYLVETRKLDLAAIPHLDAVLRFHPKCPFNGAEHPCVLALFRDAVTDEAAGIHRIALTANAEKIGRMMLGSWPNSRAIKLRPGGMELTVGEGIETTIASSVLVPADALWALGSANAIRQLPVIPGVMEITIAVDREPGNVGLDAARVCANRWHHANRKVSLLIPEREATDFNDLLKERAS